MKTYLKDLKPEEIIKRFKKGEVSKSILNSNITKLVDGVLFMKKGDGSIIVNPRFEITSDLYFETEEPFEIKETGLYRTRDGRKAFVSKIYDVYALGLIMDDEEFVEWCLDGFIFDDKREDNQDIISKWED